MTKITYYGRMDNVKPKKELAVTILDEYLASRIDAEITRFKKELKDALDKIKSDYKSDFKTINKKIKELEKGKEKKE